MSRNYHQGKYTVKNVTKYVGDASNVVYRSSWEKKLFLWLDTQRNVTKWSSEEIKIPYYYSVDRKQHTYYPDVYMEYVSRSGEIKKAIVEVKPFHQTMPPILPFSQRVTKRFISEQVEYTKNQDKWKAAREWCKNRGCQFIVITERELFNGKVK